MQVLFKFVDDQAHGLREFAQGRLRRLDTQGVTA